MGLPAGRGSVKGSRTTSKSSGMHRRGEGVALAMGTAIGGDELRSGRQEEGAEEGEEVGRESSE